MMKLITIKKHFTGILLTGLLFSACEKTEQYYDILKQQPEVFKNYESIYEVGDSMLIKGRFNERDLQIHIGDSKAEILKIEKQSYLVDFDYQDSIQQVTLRISRDMGVGANRTVQIISSGISIESPSIEIIENAQSGVLGGELTVTKIADYPSNSDPVYCRNGKGNLYFVDKTTHTVSRMDPSGALTIAFEASTLKDSGGQPINYTRLNGLGIDPKERYLYLSLYTQARGAEEFQFYWLIQYDLQNKTTKLLNKTAYHRLQNRRTLASIQPFEGNISDVKIFTANGIFPDSEGNVYFRGDHFITKMDIQGRYSYVFKMRSVSMPQVFNPNSGSYYSANRAAQFFPGVQLLYENQFNNITMNPDNQEYWTDGTLLSLEDQVLLNSFYGTSNNKKDGTPYISGSFGLLTGASSPSNEYNDCWGRLPIGKGKMIVLWYKDLDKPNFPAWGVLDYDQEKGYRYAPGAFDAKGYRISTAELLLETDVQGMLYMTANNKSVILKTIYK